MLRTEVPGAAVDAEAEAGDRRGHDISGVGGRRRAYAGVGNRVHHHGHHKNLLPTCTVQALSATSASAVLMLRECTCTQIVKPCQYLHILILQIITEFAPHPWLILVRL